MFNFFKRQKEVEKTACPKCGTFDCISLEEYQRRVKITGAGVISVRSEDILNSCMARQQINKIKHIKVESRK